MRHLRFVFPNCYRNFNPRTHEECDLSGWGDLMALSDFNPRTHEECDSLADRHYIRNYDFNPRTHEECDVHPKCVCQFADLFQSTHSRGVRRPVMQQTRRAKHISIHALTRSATSIKSTSASGEVFQSTHSRGVRRAKPSVIKPPMPLFQSTHSRGVRPGHGSIQLLNVCDFNPRTHEECDLHSG